MELEPRFQGLPRYDKEMLRKWDKSLESPAARKEFSKLLKKIPLFAAASDTFRMSLSDVLVPMDFGIGEDIFRESSPGNWAGIVLAGRLEKKILRNSVDFPCGEIAPGGIIGDIGLLGISAHRTCTLTATEPATLALLSKEAFDELVEMTGLDQYPLMKEISKMPHIIDDPAAFCDLKCFEKLEKAFVMALCGQLEPRLMYPGHTMMKEGDIGFEMFILHHGRVEVTSQNKKLAELGGGVVLGELAVLGSDKRRTATVNCLGPTFVYVLIGNVVQHLLDEYPDAKRVYDHDYVSRLLRFELEKVHDERHSLDTFFGSAHPIPSIQVKRDILKQRDAEEEEDLKALPPAETKALPPM